MEQERTWFLIGRKISGEASLEELRELEELFRKDPLLGYQCAVLNSRPNEDKDPVWENRTEAALERHLQRLESAGELPVRKNARPLRTLVAALSILVVLLAGYCIFLLDSKPVPSKEEAMAEIQTRDGSRSKALLPDGSQVWLNGGSSLKYHPGMNNNATREVHLSGEAFFEVAQNADKPFIIHTDRMEVKVLGTSFNVKAYPGDKTAEASLISGAVEIVFDGMENEKIRLAPNQKIVLRSGPAAITPITPSPTADKPVAAPVSYTVEKVKVSPQDSLVLETAWCDNFLVIDNETFEEIAIKLERWYGIIIHLSGDRLKNYHFTGTFKNETYQEILEAFRVTSPFNYKIVGNEIYINQ